MFWVTASKGTRNLFHELRTIPAQLSPLVLGAAENSGTARPSEMARSPLPLVLCPQQSGCKLVTLLHGNRCGSEEREEREGWAGSSWCVWTEEAAWRNPAGHCESSFSSVPAQSLSELCLGRPPLFAELSLFSPPGWKSVYQSCYFVLRMEWDHVYESFMQIWLLSNVYFLWKKSTWNPEGADW